MLHTLTKFIQVVAIGIALASITMSFPAFADDASAAPNVMLPSGTAPVIDLGTSPTSTNPGAVLYDPTKVGDDYKLGPGDVFDVIVNPQTEYNGNKLVVGQNGNIDYPRVGEISVSGKSLTEAKEAISTALSDFCKNFVISLSLESLRPQAVYVTGGVVSTHILDVRAASTVARAVALSGGATDRNELLNIAVLRGDQVLHSNVYPILVNGDPSSATNLSLQAGDIVVVPVNTAKFAISGAIARPGVFSLTQSAGSNEGPMRLSDAMFSAGGPASAANLGSVRIIRHDTNGQPLKKSYDYGKALQGDESQNPIIEDKDIIFVPDKSKHLDPFAIPSFVYLFRFFGGL